MILNQQVQQIAMAAFRKHTPMKTGHLRFDAVKLIPIFNYDKFSIMVDAKVAHYGHILETEENIKRYYGPRKIGDVLLPKEARPFRIVPNRHYGWITQKAVPAAVEAIADAIGGKVIY